MPDISSDVSPHSMDREFFIPAASTGEAISRIYSLTGAPPANRGEKRALVALRDALGIDVDVVRTNAILGEHLAEALGVEWAADRHTMRNKVNLAGLNLLLEGATEAYQQGALRRIASAAPASLSSPAWSDFQPAVSKIEAVTRIARLTNSPAEWLGPGSKEHKSVLVNLADQLLPDVALDRSSKTRLGRDIARALDVAWTDTCYSTGETISLEGLNVILAGAERRLGRLGSTAAELLGTPEEEGEALVAALYDGWPARPWDGRKSVEWLAASGARGANENEWQGWYFEARGRELLNAAFPPSAEPPRVRYGNTVFDYALNHVWDLKAHTDRQSVPSKGARSVTGTVILNDEEAIRACVAEQGLGFLILSGDALMDEDGSFVAWHRDFKSVNGRRKVAPSNSGLSRTRKSAFAPLHVEAFWIANTPSLDAATAAGWMKVAKQGRQAPKSAGELGADRRTKMHMNVRSARSRLAVARREWQHARADWIWP
ncbi:hypothetical protein [Nocardioides sp. LML1-1-1.1]|uniref:hypothetical protein n=1 Tax=Nocardioides sp. LML1-1-1.1 TaxID=3135248 RepID=UPI003432E9AF